ncbi:cellulase family glycosylhydrolase [Amycolatopsis sp. NBC_00345]|uniref:cellulase family glycosylhydrolase n=1 Tax=Amycolatopsis sp. NBC_00345 TaxID=2975955 RepID=UPI002E25B0F3
MRRETPRLGTGTWLGANFWSRTGGPLMWRSYDPGVVREELAVLAEHQVRVTRSFCYWPDFHPEPDVLDETKLAHFADFLDAHTELGMTSIPTFLVGHMSGENWDPAWRHGRDLYADVEMVSRQAWFIERTARRFRDHPAVAAWLISNEMPIYGRRRGEPPAPREHVTAWARLMVHAVRAGGAAQPVSIGDGAWGIEVTGVENGFSVRELAALTDFTGPHAYPADTDRVRQHLNAAFVCELAAVGGKPVVLEEFGLSGDWASAEHAAHYYRQVLHSSLLAGATGWLAWNNTDFDHLADQDPYRHHPFEMHFGLTTNTGEPKPPLRELAEFGDVLSTVDFERTRRADTGAALVVPAYLERGYPVTTVAADRTLVFDSLRQAYVAAREADLPLAFTREEDGIAEDAALYLLPSTRQLMAPTTRRLGELVRAGATLYLSYCSGTHGGNRGPWFPGLDELFGVRQQLRYGLTTPIRDDVVSFTFTRDFGGGDFVVGGGIGDFDGVGVDFGGIAAGEVLRFRAGGNEHGRALLPVEADPSDVLAIDDHGRPALVRHRLGAGWTVLCTYPLEYLAASLPEVNPEPTHRLYAALAASAGVVPAVRVADPLVFTDVLVHEDGRRFAWFLSQHEEPVTVAPLLAGGRLRTFDGELVEGVTLAAFGVAVFRLDG